MHSLQHDRRLPYDIFLSQDDLRLLRRLCHREKSFTAADIEIAPPRLANLVLYRLLQDIQGIYNVTSLGRLIANLRPSKIDDWVIVYRGYDVRIDASWDAVAEENLDSQ